MRNVFGFQPPRKTRNIQNGEFSPEFRVFRGFRLRSGKLVKRRSPGCDLFRVFRMLSAMTDANLLAPEKSQPLSMPCGANAMKQSLANVVLPVTTCPPSTAQQRRLLW